MKKIILICFISIFLANAYSEENKIVIPFKKMSEFQACYAFLIGTSDTKEKSMLKDWIEIKDFDSNHIIRVKVQDDVIIFPQDSKEKKVVVNGIFYKIEFTEKQAIQWKIHLAEEKGIKLNESDIALEPSDLIEYRIKGLGAKIITELN